MPNLLDGPKWWPLFQEELDATELGWRVVTGLIEENDPDPSINWPIWVEMAYQRECLLSPLEKGKE